MTFSSPYWVTEPRDAIIVTNGCRLNLDHLARVLAAKRLADHNRECAQ